MEVLILQTVLRTVISEGIKALFIPLKEKLYKAYRIKTLSNSILKRVSKYINSEDYDFEGYFEILIGSQVISNKEDPDIQETIKKTLKKRFLERVKEHNTIRLLKSKLKEDNYLTMKFLKEKLNLEFFKVLFGDPKLDENGNEKKKKVVESIWQAFNIEALRVVKDIDVLIQLYLDHQIDMKEIKNLLNKLVIAQEDITHKKYQYKKYIELWESLVDLQWAADALWVKATEEGIRDFTKFYIKIQMEIKKSEYHLKPEHKEELKKLLDQFKFYSDGKKLFVRTRDKKLASYEKKLENWDNSMRKDILRSGIHLDELLNPIKEANRKIRIKYLELLKTIYKHFDEIIT